MKVLIVFNHPAPYKVHIFNEIAKYVDLTVIFERTKASDRPDEFYSANRYNFECIFLTDHYIGNEGTTSNKVKDYIKKYHKSFDEIIMNGYSHSAEIKAIRYMKKHDIPFTLLINGGVIHSKEIFIKKLIKSSLIKTANWYMSPSKKSNEYLMYYGAKKEQIYNYPYSNFSEKEINAGEVDVKKIREKYNLPLNKKIFINPSQFIDRKNNLQLLEMFVNREEHLLLVGKGPEEEKYHDFINKHQMNNVTILPFLKKDELFELLKSVDAFITLAKEDIFGHTTLEALANGLPVISSNKVISSLEYIKDGYNGYIVDLNNKEEIKNAIDNIFSIKKENTYESVKNNTFEACGKAIYQILKEKNNG